MRYHRHLFEAARDALESIFYNDRYADKVIESCFRNNRKWGKRDRQFFAETVYDTVRWWRLYWYLLGKEENPKDLFLLLAVSVFHRGHEKPPFEEFEYINYEKLAEKMEALDDQSISQSIPLWLDSHGKEQLGDLWEESLKGLNEVNHIVLRANTINTQQSHLLDKLSGEGITAEALEGSKEGVLVKERVNVFRTEAFEKGLFEVQDGSSQMVADFLDVAPGQTVVDACAGAGGKSLHIGSRLQNKGRIIALDIHLWKLDQLKLRARRNKIFNIERRVIEGTKTIKRLAGKADRLLLDVPCSGLGVLRRNPDTKWKLSLSRINELKVLQADILENYCKIVKPGGIMVYATCSILPEENESQVQNFLSNNSGWKLVKQRHVFPLRPGFDGFYMAQLRKAK